MAISNPFAELSAFVSPALIQAYVVLMFLLVVGGTLLDVMHKKSGQYFFDSWRTAKKKGARQIGAGEMTSLALQTAVVDVLASGEFCNARRRVAHLLTMYGFVLHIVATVVTRRQLGAAIRARAIASCSAR
jgi:predicted ABC-type exoprotein transport system permease subunit